MTKEFVLMLHDIARIAQHFAVVWAFLMVIVAFFATFEGTKTHEDKLCACFLWPFMSLTFYCVSMFCITVGALFMSPLWGTVVYMVFYEK